MSWLVPPEYDLAENAFRELKRLTKINCWHRADYESDAMWKLHAEEGKGVAICSTPERIGEAFRPLRLDPSIGIEDMWAGDIRYEDLSKVRVKSGILERFFVKHQAFSSEQEFRLAISLRTAEENSVDIPDLGIKVSVNIPTLITRIILGPALTLEDRDFVTASARKAEYRAHDHREIRDPR